MDRSSPAAEGSALSQVAQGGSIDGSGLEAGTGLTEGRGHDSPPSYTGDAFSLEG
jgi:hypothetical protein